MRITHVLSVALIGLAASACNGQGSDSTTEGGDETTSSEGGASSTAHGGEGGEAGAGGGDGGSEPASCDDGNPCTADVAAGGLCEHHGAAEPSTCTTFTGVEGACVWTACVVDDCAHAPDGTFCMSAFPNIGTCADSACVFCETAADCDDGNPCTMDYCQLGGCYNPEDTSMSACGEGGHCYKSECCEGCIDPGSASCVVECPSGETCSVQGTCP